MSESLKYPIFKDKANKHVKRYANKRIRSFIRSAEQGFKSVGFFHKLFNSYNISDFRFYPRNEEQYKQSIRK